MESQMAVQAKELVQKAKDGVFESPSLQKGFILFSIFTKL